MQKLAYYNENHKPAAQWLRNLIDAGLIAPGIVDDRSIEDVKPSDLTGFKQVHLFAGIGGWSLALRRAGWRDDRPIWTASCPCQPFSAAGKGIGFADERHLWPSVEWLARQCRPDDILGEQSASKDADAWIDLVHADMETLGYAFGAVAFPSAGIGAPHVRERTYWAGKRLADADESRPQGRIVLPECGNKWSVGSGRMVSSSWANAEWIDCDDGYRRPIESGTFPLANGVSGRVEQIHAYGNAVNVEAARAFIEAYMYSTA